MRSIFAQARSLIGVCGLLILIGLAAPVSAQQPTSVNPTASSVNEEKLLQSLQRIDGRCSIPDQKACTIEQPAGRDWRQFHQVVLPWIGAIAIVGMLAALVIFYLRRGMVKMAGGRSGRLIVRFNELERFVHWMTATCFI